MKRTESRVAWALLACGLIVAGCSKDAGQSATAVADDGLRLTPNPPTATSQIAAVIELPNVDPSRCRYQWRRNGALISEATTEILAPSQFRKGDFIRVEVSVPESGGQTFRTLRGEVRVADCPPVVQGARLAVAEASGGAALEATPDVSDPDGDPTTSAYTWFRNGQRIDGASGARLTTAAFARGDRIVAEVVAHDGELESEPRRSDEFTLSNRAPQFSSQPAPLPPGEKAFRYQPVAADPDGDPLRFELLQAPAGMTIAANGAIEWPLPPREQWQSEYVVSLRATDGRGGEAKQDFTIRLVSPSAKP